MTLCIGLDAHKKTCTYRVKDRDGKLVASETIPSTAQELDAMLTRFPRAQVVLEASSVSRWVYQHLKQNGADVRLIHPVNIRRTLGRKSDALDAGFLADAFMLGALKECYVPSPDVEQMRELARSRAFLVRECTRLKNRIHAKLRGRGVSPPEGAAFTKANRDWLRNQNPEFPMLLRLIEHVESEIKRSDEEIRREVEQSKPLQNLMTIPGVGPLTALVVYAEIGDVDRFTSAEHVASYFGLVPGESQSGETMHRGRITKRGSKAARFVLVQAAWMHVSHCKSSSITRSFDVLVKRVGKRKAIVATARKLAKVSYHLLREERGFVDQ